MSQTTNGMRRRFLHLLGLAAVPEAGACTSPPAPARGADAGKPIGFGTLRLDADPEKNFISIFDDAGQPLAGAARLSKKIVSNSHGGPRPVPRAIRATWRSGQAYLTSAGTWIGGTVVGDYTATVAERIPEDVLDYQRRHGGVLRLKIRLVDTAVLVGWDIEKYVPVEGWKPGDGDTGFHYAKSGGDFREDKVVNGKIVEPGWQRIPRAGLRELSAERKNA